MASALLHGLATGMILQLAIGPISLYVASLTVQQSTTDGLAAVLAVTVVDYIFIVLAILGAGRLLEQERIKIIMGIGSSIILIIFGFIMLRGALIAADPSAVVHEGLSDPPGSFMKAFVLTVSSPLTIIFWTGIFTARSIERNFNRGQLWIFGMAAGFTTPLFLGGVVVLFTILRSTVSFSLAGWLNMGVGAILIAYGLMRLIRMTRKAAAAADS